MPSKMAAIQAQLERATGRAPATAVPACPAPSATPAAAARPVPARPPSREGMIHIGAYLHPDFKTSLRLVQARTGKDIQSLLADALNELFRAHNAPVVDR
jgi:hypothetical protein